MQFFDKISKRFTIHTVQKNLIYKLFGCKKTESNIEKMYPHAKKIVDGNSMLFTSIITYFYFVIIAFLYPN